MSAEPRERRIALQSGTGDAQAAEESAAATTTLPIGVG